DVVDVAVDGDVVEPGQELLQGDLQHHPGQVRPGAAVDPGREGQVPVGVAPGIEGVGVGELGRVAVGGRDRVVDGVALLDQVAVDLDVAGRPAGEADQGRVEAEELVESPGDAFGMFPQFPLQLGTVGEHLDGGRGGVGRRLHAPEDQDGQHADDLQVVGRPAGDGAAHDGVHDHVARLGPVGL